MAWLDIIWQELETPTGQVGPLDAAYRRAAGGVWHSVLGALVCAPLGLWGILPGAALAGLYWLLKERRDISAGGSRWDSAEDAVMVGLGAWYGVAWWPALICGAGLYIMAAAAWRRG